MKKILVVDDHDDIRVMLRRLLELENLGPVVEASFADEGIEIFEAEAPDVVLVDYMMPETNGVTFAEKLRSEYEFKGPIVLYSSAGELIPRATVDALEIDVIEKSSISELLDALRNAVTSEASSS